MNESTTEEKKAVYEIGYLVAGVPEERVSAENEAIRSIITDAGGEIISEEAPRLESLAYTMHKKTVSGSYDKYDEAYFGWVKFEIGSDKIEAVKKAVEIVPSVLRMLLLSTVRENTYLGKHVPADISFGAPVFSRKSALPAAGMDGAVVTEKDTTAVAAVSVEDMDKSIDEMVKEA